MEMLFVSNEMKDKSAQENELNHNVWFLELLNDIKLFTTEYIFKKVPNISFVLVEQIVSDSNIYRKIVFQINGNIICEAISKIDKNDLVTNWVTNNPDEPLGKIFKDRQMLRVLISQTENSRIYSIIGDINAQIEERFYPLPQE